MLQLAISHPCSHHDLSRCRCSGCCRCCCRRRHCSGVRAADAAKLSAILACIPGITAAADSSRSCHTRYLHHETPTVERTRLRHVAFVNYSIRPRTRLGGRETFRGLCRSHHPHICYLQSSTLPLDTDATAKPRNSIHPPAHVYRKV